jgi:hypothetical protein
VQWSDISLAPSRRTLRQFAGLWLCFFGGLACWHGFVRGHTNVAWVLAGLAATVGPLGLVWPPLVRPVFVGLTVLAFPVGWAATRLLLGVVYYGIFTPLGLAFRLSGRDPLSRTPRPGRETYWVPRPAVADVRRYFRQF